MNTLLALGLPKSTTRVEDDFVVLLVEARVLGGVEVRKWHDGTRSDVGVRPLGVDEDLWLPLQIKATKACKPKFQWNLGSKAYKMPVMLATGDPDVAFLLTPDDLKIHSKKIESDSGLIYYGTAGGYWHDALSPCKVSIAVESLLSTWRVERALHDNGILKSEMVLEMDCSLDSQREWFVTSLVSRLSIATVSTRPIHQTTVDRIEDGLRVQDKSAMWCAREDTPYFKAKCAKLLRGVEIPFAIGDADVYRFAVVLEKQRLLLEWRIPEVEMDAIGRLCHIDKECVTRMGRTCVTLPVVGPSGRECGVAGEAVRWYASL